MSNPIQFTEPMLYQLSDSLSRHFPSNDNPLICALYYNPVVNRYTATIDEPRKHLEIYNFNIVEDNRLLAENVKNGNTTNGQFLCGFDKTENFVSQQ